MANLAGYILPSFLHGAENPSRTKNQHGKTEFVDGVRGIAALIVFVHHFWDPYVTTIDVVFDVPSENSPYPSLICVLLRVPIVRLLYSGSPMVCIFFIISGFALSSKPLKVFKNRDAGSITISDSVGSDKSLIKVMASTLFRRGPRLFLPAIASTFAIMVATTAGIYGRASTSQMTGTLPRLPEALGVVAQIRDWSWGIITVLTKRTSGFLYDTNTWTLIDEFECSFKLYAILIMISQLEPRFWSVALAAIVLLSLLHGSWSIALFTAGLRLGTRTYFKEVGTQGIFPWQETKSPLLALKKFTIRVLPYLTLCFGLFLCSFPDDRAGDSATFAFLNTIALQLSIDEWLVSRIWQSVGAILVLHAIADVDGIREFFASPTMAYMGRISFSLYLVHGPFLNLIGYSLINYASEQFGTVSDIQIGACTAFPICLFAVIWTADIFWRFIDLPSQAVTRWIEEQISVAHNGV